MTDDPAQSDDDDEVFFNDDLVGREGLVSIWLNVGFGEDNKVIGWYDHDYLEGSTIGRPQPIRQALISGGSYWETWLDAAVQAAEGLGITEAYNVWMLFDHEYMGSPGRFELATGAEGVDDLPPYYLGAFRYTRH
ncbi:hypothetical protein [Actinomadura rugatobispora]|uniref:Uncharacterized protein n=1 Tax=Actinomadura rugatobispora TaxID=1994 RepID=A0ABW0ZZR4_9ACTN|nr:hypothetical protein GCM10010200_016990 [Actinomadura rugatobispora]